MFARNCNRVVLMVEELASEGTLQFWRRLRSCSLWFGPGGKGGVVGCIWGNFDKDDLKVVE